MQNEPFKGKSPPFYISIMCLPVFSLPQTTRTKTRGQKCYGKLNSGMPKMIGQRPGTKKFGLETTQMDSETTEPDSDSIIWKLWGAIKQNGLRNKRNDEKWMCAMFGWGQI